MEDRATLDDTASQQACAFVAAAQTPQGLRQCNVFMVSLLALGHYWQVLQALHRHKLDTGLPRRRSANKSTCRNAARSCGTQRSCDYEAEGYSDLFQCLRACAFFRPGIWSNKARTLWPAVCFVFGGLADSALFSSSVQPQGAGPFQPR